MKRINVKHDYILPYFVQFSKQILLFIAVEDYNQKQPFADVLQNSIALKRFCDIHRKTPLLEQLYKKETPTQVFFFEYCKIFKKSFFHRASPVAASGQMITKKCSTNKKGPCF